MFVKQWFIDFKNYFIFSIENLNLSSYISWLPSPNKAWCYTKHFVCIDLVLDGMTSENKFQKCDINNVLLLPVEMGNSKRWSVRSWKIREAIESWTGPFREIKKPNAQLNAGPLSSMIYGHTLYSPPVSFVLPPCEGPWCCCNMSCTQLGYWNHCRINFNTEKETLNMRCRTLNTQTNLFVIRNRNSMLFPSNIFKGPSPFHVH